MTATKESVLVTFRIELSQKLPKDTAQRDKWFEHLEHHVGTYSQVIRRVDLIEEETVWPPDQQ